MPSILLDTSMPVAMMKMHHSTDVSKVILCISNLKERKALHKALGIIEGMLQYKVVALNSRKGTQKKYLIKKYVLLKLPNNYLITIIHKSRGQTDITLNHVLCRCWNFIPFYDTFAADKMV